MRPIFQDSRRALPYPVAYVASYVSISIRERRGGYVAPYVSIFHQGATRRICSPYVSIYIKERRMQRHMCQFFIKARRGVYSSICVIFFIGERRGVQLHMCQIFIKARRGGYVAHMCRFFIKARRGACSSICVNFSSRRDAAPICVNFSRQSPHYIFSSKLL